MWSSLSNSLLPTKVLLNSGFWGFLNSVRQEKAIGISETYSKSQAVIYHYHVFHPLGTALQTRPHLAYCPSSTCQDQVRLSNFQILPTELCNFRKNICE